MEEKEEKTIKITKGDITTIKADAIVNAANQTLMGGGGVDGAIHRAAGPELLEECKKIPETRPGIRCPTGEARITNSYGRIKAKKIIHAVGPVWKGGTKEKEQLRRTYQKSLELAEKEKLRSIAFPNISTGAYRFPKKEAAKISLRTINEFLKTSKEVKEAIIVCYDQENYEINKKEQKEKKQKK